MIDGNDDSKAFDKRMRKARVSRTFKRLVGFLFVKRLAIKPHLGRCDDKPKQRMIFEWQKMPVGWRWF